MADCVNCKKCDYCREKDGKTASRIKDIKHLLKEINNNIKNNYMNATKNKANLAVKTQEELLNEILHRLKHLDKRQEAIANHLWRQKDQPDKPNEHDSRELVRLEAINYINSVVFPEIKAAQAEHEGEIGAQGLTDWLITQLAKPVAEYLKARAANYIIEALNELKKKAIPYAVKIADWVLEKLEDVIVKQYEQASEEQQEQFKDSVGEYFPNSRLLNKL